MATYLVIHTPKPGNEDMVRSPSRLADLARIHGPNGALPRWLKAWSPDLHDDRLFTMWEAGSADDIRTTIEIFGFLDDMEAQMIAVREWGPADVLAAVPD